MRSKPSPTLRRLVATGLVLLAPIALLVTPIVLLIAVATDLAVGRRHLPRARFVGMGAHYLVLEWLGVVASFGLWILTCFGLGMRRPASQRVHHRVQVWWARSVAVAARYWFGLRFETTDVEIDHSEPLIVLAQHASFLDAIVPTLLLADAKNLGPARHVLKSELAWDPCLGIYGARLPNYFVDRQRSDGAEIAPIELLAASSGEEPIVIFPEGTFFNKARSARAHARIAEADPERHARLELRHLLPVRPGGVGALLRGRQSSSLLFIAHRGMEKFGSFRAIADNIPFADPVSVRSWHVSRDELSAAPSPLSLIDDHWNRMDRWIGDILD